MRTEEKPYRRLCTGRAMRTLPAMKPPAGISIVRCRHYLQEDADALSVTSLSLTSRVNTADEAAR
jgi:hypothetical protein